MNKKLFKIKESIQEKEVSVNKRIFNAINKFNADFITLEFFEDLLLFIKYTKDSSSNEYIVKENDFFLMDKNNNTHFIFNNEANEGFLNSRKMPFDISDIRYILANNKISSTLGYSDDIDGLLYIEDIFEKFIKGDNFFIKGNGEVYSRKKFSVNNLSYFLEKPKSLKFPSKKKQEEVDELMQSNNLKELERKDLDILFNQSLALRYSNVSAATYFDVLEDYVVLRYFAFDLKRSSKILNGKDSRDYVADEYMRIYIDKRGYNIYHKVDGVWRYNKSKMKSIYLFAGYNSKEFSELKDTKNNRVAYLGTLLKGIDNIAGAGSDSSLSNGLTVLLYILKYPYIEQLFKIGFNVNGFIYDIYKGQCFLSTERVLPRLKTDKTNSIYKVFNMTKDQINFLLKKKDYDFFSGDTNNPNDFKVGSLSKYDFISYLNKRNIGKIGLENFIYSYEILEDYIESPDQIRMYSRSFLWMKDDNFQPKDFKKILQLFNKIYLKKEMLFEDNSEYLAYSLMAKIGNANDKSLTMVANGSLIDPLYKTIVNIDIADIESKADEIIKYYNDVISQDDDPFKKTKELSTSLELEGNNYSIIRAKTFKDFKFESDILNHCLYSTYRDAAYRGDSIIMFMRDNNDINKPLYTIELSNQNNHLEVIQIKGKNNCSIKTTEEQNFFDNWKKINDIN